MEKKTIPIQPEALLIERRAGFEQAMAHYFAGTGQVDNSAQDSLAAEQLTGLLIAALEEAHSQSKIAPLDPTVAPYYGRFGDGLSPILVDVLGADIPRSFLAKSVDSYWRSVRARLAE
jgi:hypothetical protein